MPDTNPDFEKCFGNWWDQFIQANSLGDEPFTSTDLCSNHPDVIVLNRKIRESACFFQRMHVFTLQVSRL